MRLSTLAVTTKGQIISILDWEDKCYNKFQMSLYNCHENKCSGAVNRKVTDMLIFIAKGLSTGARMKL